MIFADRYGTIMPSVCRLSVTHVLWRNRTS